MKKKRKLNKKNILLLIFIVIFLFSTTKLVLYYMDLNENKKNNKKLVNEVIKEEPVIDEVKEEPKDEFSVDFETLLNINPSVKGWIRYNNKKVDNPIVQANNNDYYLNHSYDKKYNAAASIFMDYRNTSFDDKNVVIYGHAMLDDTMFGSLANLFEEGFFDNSDNNIIKIMTKDNVLLEYQVFSYYIIEKEEYYIQTSFNSDNEFYKFIDTIARRSYRNFNIAVTSSDNILTLSTCYGTGNTTKRRVVHAVRVNSGM